MDSLQQTLLLRKRTLDPRSIAGLAAWYDVSDPSTLTLDASNRVACVGDKSGNSAVRCLVLGGTDSNNASISAIAAFGTGDFTVSMRLTPTSLAALGFLFGSAVNGFALKLNADGTLQSSKASVADNVASTGSLTVFGPAVVTYRRSGTSGAYYLNGAPAGVITDDRDYSAGVNVLGASGAGTSVVSANVFWARVYARALSDSELVADAFGNVQVSPVVDIAFSTAPKLSTSFVAAVGGTVAVNSSGDLGARICGERDLCQLTVTKQPVYLPFGGQKYGWLDGSAGNYFSTPSPAGLPADEIEFVARAKLVDWSPASQNHFIGKGSASEWQFSTRSGDGLRVIFADGTSAVKTAIVTNAVPFADGQSGWVKATVTGAGGTYTVRFYTAADSGGNSEPSAGAWTQLGSDQTGVYAGTLLNSSGVAPIEVGSKAGGAAELLSGTVHYANVKVSVGGIKLVEFDPSRYVSGTTFTAATGETWTLNGGAVVVDQPGLYFDGKDDFIAAPFGYSSNSVAVYAVGLRHGYYSAATSRYGRWLSSATGLSTSDFDNTSSFILAGDSSAVNTAFLYRNSAAVASQTAPAVGVRVVQAATINNDSGTYRRNRGLLGNGATSATALASKLTLVGRGTGAATDSFLSAVLSELVLRSAADPLALQDRFVLYFSKRWRIAL